MVLTGLLYQPRMRDDEECGAVGGMRTGRENRSTRRRPALMPFCQPQIPRDLTGVEPEPMRWESGDLPPELWHDFVGLA
jgi:hypothetical protein